MDSLGLDFIKLIFEKKHDGFSESSVNLMRDSVKRSSEIGYKVVAIKKPLWFDISKDSFEEYDDEFPIEVRTIFKDDNGIMLKGSVYLFLDLVTGELSDNLQFDMDDVKRA